MNEAGSAAYVIFNLSCGEVVKLCLGGTAEVNKALILVEGVFQCFRSNVEEVEVLHGEGDGPVQVAMGVAQVDNFRRNAVRGGLQQDVARGEVFDEKE